ncbi:hypothetical protein GCM10010238_59480 [Streptomyces griseoviridis]|uniref:Uncharacterized protein n=1 Tax=Streptomyces griseoviridis TaxID=45398 RepID=A0A918LKS4_STRGD|nr:hypothetical protein GCM10010238_59480 [Streptomyces niveoruber]
MGGGNSGTGRREVVLGQFDHAGEVARVRLAGLGDEEYRGEPVPGRWSVRRREEAVTPRAYGPGEGVLGLGAPDIPRASTRRSPGRPRAARPPPGSPTTGASASSGSRRSSPGPPRR